MSKLEYLKRLFIVRKCVACREILSQACFNSALCPECRLAFEVAKTESCPMCGKAAFECTCQPKMLSNGGSLCLRKLFFYHPDKDDEPQNRLIYFMKHYSSRRAPYFVAAELWILLKRELDTLGVDVDAQCLLVNMPRGRSSVLKYGFDQSAETCKALSSISNIPYAALLKRKLGGKEQKKLNATERKKNVSKAIYANNKLEKTAKNKYVILFDDVVTTGASMSACLPILRKMGVKGVICCSLAADVKNKSVR